MNRVRGHFALRTASSVLILSALALACARASIPIKTSPYFTVRVSNDYGPVVGLRLLVTHFRVEEYDRAIAIRSVFIDVLHPNIKDYVDVIATSVTDSKGEAQFHLNKTGRFELVADHPEADLGDIILDVTGDATSAVVAVKWPEGPVLETTLVKGSIEDGLFKSKGEPLKEANVSLHELVSYKEIAQTDTSDSGSFQLSSIQPGIYFLRLKAKEDGPNSPNGDIAIVVKPSAPRESLPIAVHESDCGLSYDLVENKSRYKPIVCVKAGKQVPCPY